MPSDDGFRLDDDERGSPSGPRSRQPRPEQPVRRHEPQPSRSRPIQHLKLVPQDNYLKLPCAARPKTTSQREDQRDQEEIIGRKAGTVPGFSYSNAMKKSDIVWDTKILDAYLESPQQVVPGNRMPYAGLKNPTDRTDLVAYLGTLK